MSAKFSKHLLFTSVAACLLLEAAPAMAQVQEITVVARKRQESIMKVPVVETAITGDALSQYAIGDVKGISDRVPGLNIGSQVLSAGVQVSLRGIGTSTLNPTIDQSVALVVDGMQMTQGLAFQAATFDMAQAEILKGPQALFYGKAAPAGVIAIRTADPTDEVEVILRGGYEFDAKEKQGEIILSGPVADTLGLRLAAQYSAMDGYFENSITPANLPVFGSLGAKAPRYHHFPNGDNLLLRGTAVWKPADRFNARLKINFNQNNYQGTGGEPEYSSCPDGTSSPIAGIFGINLIGGQDCKLDGKFNISDMDPSAFPGIKNGGVPYNKLEQTFGSLELNYDLRDDLKLTSVTGLYKVAQEALINAQTTTQFGTPFVAQVGLERHDVTEEVRLTSDFDNPVNFMIGGFYQNGEMDFWTDLPFNQTWALINPALSFTKLGEAQHKIDIEAYSFFGQVLWKIIPDLELGAGARWAQENRTHHVSALYPPGVGPRVPVALGKPNIGSSNWSPEITLTYTPTDDLTLFGAFKQAYKSGSFNSAGIPVADQDTSFGDERVRGGEAGIKSRLLGGDLAVNASGYYYKYRNLQVDANDFDGATQQLIARTINAAASKLYGIDLDVTYTPPAVEGLTLFGAANWNKARYTMFDNALCWGGQTIAQGCDRLFSPTANSLFGGAVIIPGFTAQDLSGQPLVRAPEWTANFGFDYERPVFNDMTLRFGSNTTYSSSYSAGLENRADEYQDGYVKTSARVSLSGPDDGWMVEVIGDNLTDKIVTGNCVLNAYADTQLLSATITGTTLTGPSGVDEVACNPERGRAVWVRLTLKPLALLNK